MHVKTHVAEIALRYVAALGEGPVWDERKNLLFWIDSTGNKACMFNPETGENKTYALGQNVGTLVPTEDVNTVIVGLEDGLYALDLTSGALTLKSDLERDRTGNRLNDGKADAAGRIWIGSMSLSDNGAASERTREEIESPCALYRVDPDYACATQVENVKLSNGMAWSRDNKTFYYIDTLAGCVFAFDFDLAAGELSNRRTCVVIPQEMGMADGMDIDIDGNLWIAHWGGWCVGKWDPRTGELLEKVEVPACRVASCAFGGKEYDELYIVTCSETLPSDGGEQPDAGCVFVARGLGTRGLPFHCFKGEGGERGARGISRQ